MNEPTLLEATEAEIAAIRRDLQRRVDRLRALEDLHGRAVAAQAEYSVPVTLDVLWSQVGGDELAQAEFGALLARCIETEKEMTHDATT